MASPTRRASQHITLLIVVLASITVLTLNYRGAASHGIGRIRAGVVDAISPLQRGVAAALHPVADFFSGALQYHSVLQQNVALRQEVQALKNEGAVAAYETSRAEQVLSLTRLGDASGLQSVVADVLVGPSSNFEQTDELGLGTSSGVGVDMPVESGGGLGGGGLVGQVVSAGASTSTMLLIDDRRFSVDVRFGLAGSNAVTVLHGEGPGQPLSATVSGFSLHRGERVYTSGLAGALFPAGIPVGTVRSVSTSGLTETVSVSPYADPGGLQYVAVLLWTPTA